MVNQSWSISKVEQWPTAKLLPYARNARTHSEAQVGQIASSIKEFGFTNPILAGSDGVIVAGHGRLAAAQILGLGSVPVIVLDLLGLEPAGSLGDPRLCQLQAPTIRRRRYAIPALSSLAR